MVTGEPRIGAGELLRAFRQRHGLALKDLAALLGIEADVVHQYECGEAPSWIEYVLVGLEYEASGTVYCLRAETDEPRTVTSVVGALSCPRPQ